MKANFNPPTLIKILNRAITITALLALVLSWSASSVPITVYAQGGQPVGGGQGGGGGVGLDPAGQKIVSVFENIAKLVIQILVFSSVAIFAVSLARGTWSAQLANLVGSPSGVSQAWMNILAAIFLFVIAVLSPLVVNMVFNLVKADALGALSNAVPAW
jgi:hypothetical protein